MQHPSILGDFAKKYQQIKQFAEKYFKIPSPASLLNRDLIGDFAGKYRFIIPVTLPGGISFDVTTMWYKNLITINGRTLILNLMKPGSGATAPGYIAVGNPTTANPASLSDSALQQEAARAAITSATVTASTGNYNIMYQTSLTASQINGTTEIGVLNASSNGTLLCRSALPSPISGMPNGTVITVQYQISMTSSIIVNTWTKYGSNYTYNTPLAAGIAVQSVIETDSGNGYQLVGSAAEVESTPNSYYFGGGYLYIRCSGTSIPSAHTISVQTGG